MRCANLNMNENKTWRKSLYSESSLRLSEGVHVSLTDLRQPQWGYLSKPWWTFIDHHIQAADRYGRAPADQLFHATLSEGK